MAGGKPRRPSLKKWRKALSSTDPLGGVRELVPNDGTGAQQVIVYAYACILETNSAGLSILFDRYDDHELEKIGDALETIGAARTLTDLRELQSRFRRAIADGLHRLDASEAVNEQPEARRIDKDYEAHVQEMKEKLLRFCQTHLEELAAGQSG